MGNNSKTAWQVELSPKILIVASALRVTKGNPANTFCDGYHDNDAGSDGYEVHYTTDHTDATADASEPTYDWIL